MVAIENIEVKKSENEIAKELRDLFIDIGVNYRSRGFKYLITACTESIFNPLILSNGITKQLYPNVAKFYGTTCSCVEHCIRSSIENIELNDNPKATEIFGRRAQKLTNSMFISAVSDYIRINSLN